MTDETNQLPAEVKLTPIMEMMQTAVARGDIEVVTKLMDLQERAEAAQARREFDAAFAAVKAKVGIVRKTGMGHNGKPYADMADIARALDHVIAEHGLSYRFRSQRVGNEMLMTCVVCHRAGHYEENSLPSPLDTSGSKNPVQAVGSTSTYLARYCLIQAFGLASSVNGDIHDDDGQGAAVVNGWPRGSIEQPGDYTGNGTRERDTKPKQEPKYTRTLNAAMTHLSRADAMVHELEICERVRELDAMACEIEQRPEYAPLPQTMKDRIAQAYAATLARLQSEVVIEPEPGPSISERAIKAREYTRPPNLQEVGAYDFPNMPEELKRK